MSHFTLTYPHGHSLTRTQLLLSNPLCSLCTHWMYCPPQHCPLEARQANARARLPRSRTRLDLAWLVLAPPDSSPHPTRAPTHAWLESAPDSSPDSNSQLSWMRLTVCGLPAQSYVVVLPLLPGCNRRHFVWKPVTHKKPVAPHRIRRKFLSGVIIWQHGGVRLPEDADLVTFP